MSTILSNVASEWADVCSPHTARGKRAVRSPRLRRLEGHYFGEGAPVQDAGVRISALPERRAGRGAGVDEGEPRGFLYHGEVSVPEKRVSAVVFACEKR